MSVNEETQTAVRARRREHGGTYRAVRAFAKAEREAIAWNARHPVGTPCTLEIFKGGPKVETVTRSAAWALPSGDASVMVEGYPGSYGLQWLKTARRAGRTRSDSIVGKRSGSVVVLSAKGKTMTVRCDCGREREMHSTRFYCKGVTCGDPLAHPEITRVVHGLTRDYRYNWLRDRNRPTCARWADPLAFVADVGERPAGHSLSKTSRGVASCGTCEGCKATGHARNVIWTPGGGSAAPVLYYGVLMSQAEIGRREGVDRRTVSTALLMGLPLEGMGSGAPSSTG